MTVRYDWVQVAATGDALWYARLLLLFSCSVAGVAREMVLLQWLAEVDVPRRTRLSFWRGRDSFICVDKNTASPVPIPIVSFPYVLFTLVRF